ncbi:hypothetical protein HY990_04265 [Candidatus Micrarchaeota archaeon]|nr:hypothetical protein [Candidatus Micrarchaeota archaeon]
MADEGNAPNASDKSKEAAEAEKKIRSALREALDESGYSRMMNISVVNKSLYVAAVKYVLGAARRVGRKISERELLEILRSIKAQSETETSIKFHSK